MYKSTYVSFEVFLGEVFLGEVYRVRQGPPISSP